MNVYIPSTKRVEKLELHRGPLAHMVVADFARIRYVVPEDEAESYQKVLDKTFPGVTVLSCPEKGIAKTRHWIGRFAKEHSEPTFIMLDDDIRFYRRITNDEFHLRYTEPHEFGEMLKDVEHALTSHAHVGISAREGNNRFGDCAPRYTIVQNTRTLRALAYQTEAFLSCQHGRVEVMEDFDVNLQLLEKGLPNCILVHWAQGQAMTNAPGGCSTYRTHQLHDESARKLASLHPKFVHLRIKENKSGGAFGIRTEVTIRWKDAFESAYANR